MPTLDIPMPSEEWAKLTPEQWSYMLFLTLESIDKRVSALEKQKILNSSMMALGSGIIGGISAIMGIKTF